MARLRDFVSRLVFGKDHKRDLERFIDPKGRWAAVIIVGLMAIGFFVFGDAEQNKSHETVAEVGPVSAMDAAPDTTIPDARALARRKFAEQKTQNARQFGDDDVTFSTSGPESTTLVVVNSVPDNEEEATMVAYGYMGPKGYITLTRMRQLGFSQIEIVSESGRWNFPAELPANSQYLQR